MAPQPAPMTGGQNPWWRFRWMSRTPLGLRLRTRHKIESQSRCDFRRQCSVSWLEVLVPAVMLPTRERNLLASCFGAPERLRETDIWQMTPDWVTERRLLNHRTFGESRLCRFAKGTKMQAISDGGWAMLARIIFLADISKVRGFDSISSTVPGPGLAHLQARRQVRASPPEAWGATGHTRSGNIAPSR